MKFAKHIFELGNQILGYKKPERENELDREENFVLIGGPGHGKSTICQFIAQIYRMHYLRNENYTSQLLDEFFGEIQMNYKYKLNRCRIPFKIVLREYAVWINRQTGRNISEVPLKTLRRLLIDFAWIFFFDGLDEVPESSNRKEVLKQLHIFITIELKETACDCIIISTEQVRPQSALQGTFQPY